MDWRVLVLIVSLLANAYLFSSLRQLEFQARELTQSATRQRRELAAIAVQLDQSINASKRVTDGISEKEIGELISTIAKAEADNHKPDCTGLNLRNSQRLRTIQARFRQFAANFDAVSKKSSGTEIANPARMQQVVAQLKSEVLAECKR